MSDMIERIFKVLLTADGGCEDCARNLCGVMGDEFPEWKADLDALWERRAEFKPYVLDAVYGPETRMPD